MPLTTQLREENTLSRQQLFMMKLSLRRLKFNPSDIQDAQGLIIQDILLVRPVINETEDIQIMKIKRKLPLIP